MKKRGYSTWEKTSYRCGFSPFDHPFSEYAHFLPVVDHPVHLASYMCELVLEIARDRHLLCPIYPLACGFLFRGDWRASAPILEGLLREKSGEGSVIPNHRMVDNKVQKPGKASPE
jgi:hypothetical protein